MRSKDSANSLAFFSNSFACFLESSISCCTALILATRSALVIFSLSSRMARSSFLHASLDVRLHAGRGFNLVSTSRFMEAKSRPPLKSLILPSFQILRDGYPFTPCSPQEACAAPAQSHIPMTTFGVSANSFPSFSQSGAIFLQCPHQGACMNKRASLPSRDFLKFLSVSSIMREFTPAKSSGSTASRCIMANPWSEWQTGREKVDGCT
mmetsp:Transcript_28955/g.46470  ORF Transcript_28955/g.46470 Transcript_28955/m.46470 type:complete len:209 (+) Transcript_28955:642-1268(+)